MKRLAPLLPLLAIAGCGGGSSDPSPSQLRARATSICSAANVRSYHLTTPTWNAGAGRFLRDAVNVLSPELQRLRRLTPPSSDANVYDVALDAVSRELGALRSAASAIGRNEDPVIAYKALERRLAPLEAQANDAWGALDIPACAG